MFIYYNPNPYNLNTIDCVIRAISIATGKSWNEVFVSLAAEAFEQKDMMTTNTVWEGYLIEHENFKKYLMHKDCPTCYTIEDFCYENPIGVYILGTGNHVVTAINGDYYDTWDSGYANPKYFLTKE